MVEVENIRGFCPGSQLGQRVQSFDELVGRTMTFKVRGAERAGAGGRAGTAMLPGWVASGAPRRAPRLLHPQTVFEAPLPVPAPRDVPAPCNQSDSASLPVPTRCLSPAPAGHRGGRGEGAADAVQQAHRGGRARGRLQGAGRTARPRWIPAPRAGASTRAAGPASGPASGLGSGRGRRCCGGGRTPQRHAATLALAARVPTLPRRRPSAPAAPPPGGRRGGGHRDERQALRRVRRHWRRQRPAAHLPDQPRPHHQRGQGAVGGRPHQGARLVGPGARGRGSGAAGASPAAGWPRCSPWRPPRLPLLACAPTRPPRPPASLARAGHGPVPGPRARPRGALHQEAGGGSPVWWRIAGSECGFGVWFEC